MKNNRFGKAAIFTSEEITTIRKSLVIYGLWRLSPRQEMNYFLTPYKSKYNKDYDNKVAFRKQEDNKVEVDLTDKLELAHKTLLEAQKSLSDFDNIDENNKPNWRIVSCAIALCIGRRASEIHLLGKFEKVYDYHLTFKRQLKGKNRTINGTKLIDEIFTIPSLFKADLIIDSLEYLNLCGYRFDESFNTTNCNNKVSRSSSREVQANWELYEPIYDAKGKKIDSQTYHRFRATYYTASCVNYAQDNQDTSGDVYLSTDYAKEIMGDCDDKTLQSYRRFKNKPNGLTKI